MNKVVVKSCQLNSFEMTMFEEYLKRFEISTEYEALMALMSASSYFGFPIGVKFTEEAIIACVYKFQE